MSAALLLKSCYDNRWGALIVACGVTLFPILILQAFTSFPWDLAQQWLEIPWIAGLIRALTGAEFSSELSITTLGSFAFVHPVMLAMTWGYIIMAGTRGLCGEIDRGTADATFTTPASRLRAYASVSVPVFLACPLLALCMWNGVWIGDKFADLPGTLRVFNLHPVVVNACAMHVAVAGMTLLLSAAASRRGKTVGVMVGLLIASFLINTLSALWKPAQSLAFLGLLNYFKPFVVARDGYQWGNIAVLLAIAATTWIAGAVIFHRRDIPAA